MLNPPFEVGLPRLAIYEGLEGQRLISGDPFGDKIEAGDEGVCKGQWLSKLRFKDGRFEPTMKYKAAARFVCHNMRISTKPVFLEWKKLRGVKT